MTADPIRTLIADDEPLARDRIRELLGGRSGFDIVGECGSGRETVAAVRSLHPQLLFLDVQMPRLNGFAVLQSLDPREWPAVVFVTAYDHYAIAAFEVHAVDYLLKPFEDGRFDESLRRVVARLEHRRLPDDLIERLEGLLADPATRAAGAEHPLCHLVIKEGERSRLLPVDAVDWIEAADDYAAVHAAGARHLVRESLASLERALDRRFVRIHRSSIVNLDRVQEFQRLFHGDFAVLLHDGTSLKLSRTHRAHLEQRLGRPL